VFLGGTVHLFARYFCFRFSIFYHFLLSRYLTGSHCHLCTAISAARACPVASGLCRKKNQAVTKLYADLWPTMDMHRALMMA
jgi:hypothetical protein